MRLLDGFSRAGVARLTGMLVATVAVAACCVGVSSASAAAVIKTIPVGEYPLGVSSDGTHVWVANEHSFTVSEIDASTGTVVNTIPCCGVLGDAFGEDAPAAVSSDGTHVWVTDDGTVSEIDASTGTVVNEIPGGNADEVSSDGTHVWDTTYAPPPYNTVSEIDASTGTVVNEISVGSYPAGVSSDGTHVWVANSGGDTVSEIDASTGTVVNTITVGADPEAVSSDGTHVWVTNELNGTVSEIDASTGTVVNTIPVNDADAVSSDGTHVWVTDGAAGGGDTVSEIDASTGTVVNTITVGNDPDAVSSDGTHVWVTNAASGTVSEILIAAAAPPSAVTDPASAVAQAAAALNATVNPNGSAVTECKFEYGTSTSYGSSVPCSPAASELGSGESPVAVSAAVTGLAPKTTYHFKITARNAVGPSNGADQTFKPLPPISITGIKLQQRSVRSGAMEELGPEGTVDGNNVDVIAVLHNDTPEKQETEVSFGNPTDNSASVGIQQPFVSVEPEATRMVDEVLNTSGLAWTNNEMMAPQYEVKVSLADETSETTRLTVRPKPVILVHGLASSAATWIKYVGPGGFLQSTNPLWHGYAVGDGQAPGKMDTSAIEKPGHTIAENASQEALYIEGVRQETNAEHVDLVGHSMGGLISRYYIQDLMPAPLPGESGPVVSHLVMLGTPNEGSPCPYLALAAELPLAVIPGLYHLNEPLLQNTTGSVLLFDKEIDNTRGVQFSVLAGDLPLQLCSGSIVANDGLVAEQSTWYIYPDKAALPLTHIEETGSLRAFSEWVKPHLAVGPSKAHGGNYTGPLASSDSPAPSDPPASSDVLEASRFAATRARAAFRPRAVPTATGQKAKLCLVAAPAPPISAGETTTLPAGGKTSMAIAVPAHAGKLTAVILAQATVTTQLLDPGGRVMQTIAAGSTAAGGLFRTLTVSSPRAGTWHLEATASGGEGSEIVIAIEFGHPPSQAKLSVTQVKPKGKHAVRGTALRFTARVSANGRPVRGARVAVSLVVEGQRAVTLRLQAVRGHLGMYAAQTAALKKLAPATVFVRSSTRAGTSASALQLQTSCAKAA